MARTSLSYCCNEAIKSTALNAVHPHLTRAGSNISIRIRTRAIRGSSFAMAT